MSMPPGFFSNDQWPGNGSSKVPFARRFWKRKCQEPSSASLSAAVPAFVAESAMGKLAPSVSGSWIARPCAFAAPAARSVTVPSSAMVSRITASRVLGEPARSRSGPASACHGREDSAGGRPSAASGRPGAANGEGRPSVGSAPGRAEHGGEPLTAPPAHGNLGAVDQNSDRVSTVRAPHLAYPVEEPQRRAVPPNELRWVEPPFQRGERLPHQVPPSGGVNARVIVASLDAVDLRSEERRVGKE